jgi:hypothetical protein
VNCYTIDMHVRCARCTIVAPVRGAFRDPLDDQCYPTGKLVLNISDIPIPDGWVYSNVHYGFVCPGCK